MSKSITSKTTRTCATQLNTEIAVLIGLEKLSPRAAAWLGRREVDERGDISTQQIIWYAIGMAGSFAVAVLIYNALKNQAIAKNGELNNPAPMPGGQ
jgi:hypothetical protein